MNPTSAVTTDGKLASLPTPVRSGYTFAGWYTQVSGGQSVTTDTVFAEAATIYAHWTSNSSSSGSKPTYQAVISPMEHGSIAVTPQNATKGSTVTITVSPDSGYVLDQLTVTNTAGNPVNLTKESDNTYTFTMPGSKVTLEASFLPEDCGFVDVPRDAYYYNAVRWAVGNGITNGTSDTTFSPDMTCTRAQAVTFLWRAAGSPKSTSADAPFTDLQSGAYYMDAVRWAVEQGITNGTSATTFSPDMAMTRSQLVALLYRANGAPAVSGTGVFTDVDSDAYYYHAVLWAAEQKITNGTSATTFSPDVILTRGQMVTFLYRIRE